MSLRRARTRLSQVSCYFLGHSFNKSNPVKALKNRMRACEPILRCERARDFRSIINPTAREVEGQSAIAADVCQLYRPNDLFRLYIGNGRRISPASSARPAGRSTRKSRADPPPRSSTIADDPSGRAPYARMKRARRRRRPAIITKRQQQLPPPPPLLPPSESRRLSKVGR